MRPMDKVIGYKNIKEELYRLIIEYNYRGF